MKTAEMNIDEVIKKYNQEIADFYEVKPRHIKVEILSSRKEIDSIKGYPTESWVVGFTKNNIVYILSKEKWETESAHSSDGFEKALKHEIAHLYYYTYKDNVFPNWLNEGMAILIAEQDFMCHYKNEITIQLLDEFHSYHKNRGAHEIGGTLVKNIYDQYGKGKLLKIVKIGNKEERYRELKKMFDWLK